MYLRGMSIYMATGEASRVYGISLSPIVLEEYEMIQKLFKYLYLHAIMDCFYSASIGIACSATAVIIMALSVCLSVCISVTFRCFVEMNEATIMWFSLSGSKIILVSGEVKIIRKFAGDHPQRGRQSEVVECRKRKSVQ